MLLHQKLVPFAKKLSKLNAMYKKGFMKIFDLKRVKKQLVNCMAQIRFKKRRDLQNVLANNKVRSCSFRAVEH